MTTALLPMTGKRLFPRHRATSPLGVLLDAHMDTHGISQTSLADTLLCDPSYLARIRVGERQLGGNYEIWAEVLGVDVPTIILMAHNIDVAAYEAGIRADERMKIAERDAA
jgi:hypothetical protein